MCKSQRSNEDFYFCKVVENKCSEETVEGSPCQSVVVQRFGEDDWLETFFMIILKT